MLNQATMDMLTAMKMTAMAAEFANQLKDPTFNELGFEERLGLLVNAEWNRRQSNKLILSRLVDTFVSRISLDYAATSKVP